MQMKARLQERRTMRDVAHIITVSAAYTPPLLARYPWLDRCQFTTIPFGALREDLDIMAHARVRQNRFDPQDGNEHWVYVGRAGGDMSTSLGGLFSALSRARSADPRRWSSVRLHFIGTSYAPGARAVHTVLPLAQRYGVADLVSETPNRIPYFEGLRCLSEANALIVPGSDDAAYTASKIYPYVLARKPLLVVFRHESSVREVVQIAKAGVFVGFGESEREGDLANEIFDRWFRPGAIRPPETDWVAFEQFTAEAMTRRICGVFDAVLHSP
jgi:hypothetical protein